MPDYLIHSSKYGSFVQVGGRKNNSKEYNHNYYLKNKFRWKSVKDKYKVGMDGFKSKLRKKVGLDARDKFNKLATEEEPSIADLRKDPNNLAKRYEHAKKHSETVKAYNEYKNTLAGKVDKHVTKAKYGKNANQYQTGEYWETKKSKPKKESDSEKYLRNKEDWKKKHKIKDKLGMDEYYDRNEQNRKASAAFKRYDKAMDKEPGLTKDVIKTGKRYYAESNKFIEKQEAYSKTPMGKMEKKKRGILKAINKRKKIKVPKSKAKWMLENWYDGRY